MTRRPVSLLYRRRMRRKIPLETKRILLDYCPAERILKDQEFANSFKLLQRIEEIKTQESLIPTREDLGTIKLCKCSGILKKGAFVNAEKNKELTHQSYNTPFTKGFYECSCTLSFEKGTDFERIKKIFEPGIKAVY